MTACGMSRKTATEKHSRGRMVVRGHDEGVRKKEEKLNRKVERKIRYGKGR